MIKEAFFKTDGQTLWLIEMLYDISVAAYVKETIKECKAKEII